MRPCDDGDSYEAEAEVAANVWLLKLRGLQVAAMRLAQRHAGVGLAAALRLVLVVVHCSTCFCQGVRSTFAQCTAAAGRLYAWRPAEG